MLRPPDRLAAGSDKLTSENRVRLPTCKRTLPATANFRLGPSRVAGGDWACNQTLHGSAMLPRSKQQGERQTDTHDPGSVVDRVQPRSIARASSLCVVVPAELALPHWRLACRQEKCWNSPASARVVFPAALSGWLPSSSRGSHVRKHVQKCMLFRAVHDLRQHFE